MINLESMGRMAKTSAYTLAKTGTDAKNMALKIAAKSLLQRENEILAANAIDLENARQKGMKDSLIDRLALNHARIEAMAEGLYQIVALEDTIGQVTDMKTRPNGLMIGKMTVPLGVIGIIYESRPNVTVDAFGLCFKTGNAVILKGGSDAINSNRCLVEILQKALVSCDLPKACVQFIDDTDRETTMQFMRMNDYVDVIIPRGGAGLIKSVVANSTVPVIETGTGNCHVYVDETADIDMAVNIIINAKTQRTGVCNACESLVVHKNALNALMSKLESKLAEKNVVVKADETACMVAPSFQPATEEDWGTEYLDLMLSVKTVDNINQAISHINKYNTGHSEAIITNDYNNAQKFLKEIDAAAVYVNASTRFTDGFEFGFGAEIGISTQKMHARGPMGLKELTTYKYIIYGNGQVRK